MSFLFPALGTAVALAGSDKLVGMQGYEGMFQRLGWSSETMRMAAAAEVLGGLLMIPDSTRRLGGALVAATSAAVLTSELEHNDTNLALPRCAIMLVALAATARRAARRKA